jgi:hypothetical protein
MTLAVDAMALEYQIGFLGQPTALQSGIVAQIKSQAHALGLAADTIQVMDEIDVPARDRKRPFIGVFVGYHGATDAAHPVLPALLKDSVVILPLVAALSSASTSIPPSLSHINCLECPSAKPNVERIVSVLFENFRLLRAERRLFISYRRRESQGVAIQLYETLDAAGFDVFLDTHGVPPATDFQSILWHRLADSDVVILLDTPDFRASRWTVQELGRANATSIQILHLLWPGVLADPYSAFSQFQKLKASDFVGAQIGADAQFTAVFAGTIPSAVETLRARAMASRYRYLVDNFCDRARDLNQNANVQSTRYIALELSNAKKVAVVPAIGVPNAARYQEIQTAITSDPKSFEKIWLLYDERGILQGWLDHVDWLNRHLPVRAVQVSASSDLIAQEAI